MSWWAIEVGPVEHDRDLVGRQLVSATGQAVEELPSGLLLGYQEGEAAAGHTAAALRERFAGLGVVLRPAPPVDWSSRWREGLLVRTVGGLEIGPSWLLRPGPGRVVVDPEMAFGTGEHGSTRGALVLMARCLTPAATVLDLGSGSGILAIAAVKLGAARALGIDVDPDAGPVAEANAVRNGVAGAAGFVTGDAALLAPLAGPADLIVSNILRTANTGLLGPVARALRPGGTAVFAGMETAEAPLFRPALAAAGFGPAGECEDGGWWAVAARPG